MEQHRMEISRSGLSFVIANANGSEVALSALGANAIAIKVPDRDGKLENILDSEVGGQIWTATPEGDNSIAFMHGKRKIEYIWRGDDTLEMYLTASACSVAAMRLDLNGASSRCALEQSLYINASRYLDNKGVSHSVEGTSKDFTVARKLSQITHGDTLKARWIINDWEEGVMNEAAVLASSRNGRQVSIFTTLPCIAVDIAPQSVGIRCNALPQQRLPGQQLIFLEFKNF